MVKNLPPVQETQGQSLGQEDPRKGMASHSSILAWRIPWTEEPGGLQFIGSQRIGHDRGTYTHTHNTLFKKMEVILNGEKLSRRAEARKCKPTVKKTSVILAVECGHFIFVGAFQVVLVVKNPPANAGDFVIASARIWMCCNSLQ